MDNLIEWHVNQHVMCVNSRYARAHWKYTHGGGGGELIRQWWYDFDHKRRCVQRQERAFSKGHRSPFCLA